jgi:hypothetical protein
VFGSLPLAPCVDFIFGSAYAVTSFLSSQVVLSLGLRGNVHQRTLPDAPSIGAKNVNLSARKVSQSQVLMTADTEGQSDGSV